MRNFLRLFSYLKGQYLLYLLALMFALLAQIAAALQPGLIKITVDSVLGNEPLTHTVLERFVMLFGSAVRGANGLLIMAALIIAFALCRSIFTFLQMNIANAATERGIQNIRNRLYNHIQLLPYTYHANAKTGNLIQRCTSDVDTIRIALYSQIPETVSSVFLIIYTVFLMMQANSKLALISSITVPVAAAFSGAFFYVVEKQFEASSEREAAMTAVLQESLTGIRVIKAFTCQQYEIKKFKTASEAYMKQNLTLIRCFACFWSGSDFLSYVQIFTVILYGSFLAYRGEISVGMLIAFISYISILIQPVHQLGRILGNIGKACVSVGRIEEIFREEPEELFPSQAKPEIKGDIVFNSVSFAYPGTENTLVLDAVSFSIKQGQTAAILGPTGSGKSSLVHLLDRLYDYTAGSITIDGIELRTIDKGWIRSQIGLILQEPFLYAKTIIENIKLAVPDINNSIAQQYAGIAALDSEIRSFADGYDTLVGERGVSLSGGQKQRLAIARTLIKDSPVLIFDDSLSAVDMETDAAIRAALKNENKHKTVIIISHRIATVKDADTIIVLEKGKITQQGTHSELMGKDGLYKRIYDIQNNFS
ncbi:MAG: ABC transporter ATP-binding protein [Treponema sp.]